MLGVPWWLLALTPSLLLTPVVDGSPLLSDAACPQGIPCECNSTASGVQVTCSPVAIEPAKLNFSRLPSETTNLSVICTSSQQGIMQEQAFLHLHFLQEFRITNCSIPDLPSGTFSGLSNVTLIHFNGLGQLGHINNRTFVGASVLESLELSHNGITYIEMDAFRDGPRITFLSLGNNHLMDYPTALNLIDGLLVLDLSYNGIKSIPSRHSMPMYESLTGLSFGNNNITYLPRLAFSWAPKLLVLDLRFNKIHTVEYASFEGIPNLRRLILTGNHIGEINIILKPLLSLTHLAMAGNNVQFLQKESLPKTLEQVDFSFNLIYSFETMCFDHMDNLQEVYLQSNGVHTLTKLMIAVSSRVRYHPRIYFSGNVFSCNCQLQWLSSMGQPEYPIKYAILPDIDQVRCAQSDLVQGSPTLAEVDPSDFLCIYDEDCVRPCDCCYLDGCPCSYPCPDGCTCFSTDDKEVNIIDCHQGNLTCIPSQLHPIATVLHMDGNPIGKLNDLAFRNSYNAKELFLNNSHITALQEFAFHGLESLEYLYLQGNYIACLHSDTFQNLYHLKGLMLQQNVIHFIANDTLSNIPSLDMLFLHENLLQIIPNDLYNISPGLSSLRLAGNPWLCDCVYGPDLQNWLATEAGLVEDLTDMWCYMKPLESMVNPSGDVIPAMPDTTVETITDKGIPGATCGWPSELFNLSSLLMKADFSLCMDNSTVSMGDNSIRLKLRHALLSLGIVSVVVLVITLIGYNTRELVQVWLFKHYGLRFHSLVEDNKKRFDGFVSYSHKDEPFVMNVLAPNLEEREPHYNLVLHYRDWLVGGSIAESILDSVDNSKRMILVLTDNYVQSEWCHYEFKMAHHNVITEGKNRIIVILLGDVLPKNMGSDLKLYTKTTTYLRYDDPWFWEKLRLAMPDKHNRQHIPMEDAEPLDQCNNANAGKYVGDTR